MPASGYAKFPIVDYCYNSFSQEEKDKLRNDWEIVSNHLQQVYHDYLDEEKRNEQLVGFTHLLRPQLLLDRAGAWIQANCKRFLPEATIQIETNILLTILYEVTLIKAGQRTKLY